MQRSEEHGCVQKNGLATATCFQHLMDTATTSAYHIVSELKVLSHVIHMYLNINELVGMYHDESVMKVLYGH
jgi:hypothetical protein